MNIILQFLQSWGALLLSAISILIALISLLQSSKNQTLQNQVNDIELKIKEYELEKIKEQEKETSVVEARIINISKGKYRLKVWNSGNTTAYSINVHLNDDANIIIFRDKLPFDELEPNKNFELPIAVHMGSAPKFKIITEWKDVNGKEFKKEQMGDI